MHRVPQMYVPHCVTRTSHITCHECHESHIVYACVYHIAHTACVPHHTHITHTSHTLHTHTTPCCHTTYRPLGRKCSTLTHRLRRAGTEIFTSVCYPVMTNRASEPGNKKTNQKRKQEAQRVPCLPPAECTGTGMAHNSLGSFQVGNPSQNHC